MSSTANRVVKNTGFLYAKMGITMFISLYITRLILNSLGASDFGIYNIVGGAISMLGFLNSAMASATQRFMSYSEGEGNLKKEKSIFNVSIILHFLIAIIAGIALVIVGYFFFHGILNIPHGRIFAAKVVYGSLIVSTMFTVMTVPYDAAMNAHENMRYYALVGILESFFKLAVAFACVYTSKDKLIVYGVLMACVPLISLTIMRIYCHRHYEECITAPRKYWNKGLMKEMTSFAGWNFVGSAVTMVSQGGLGIILNMFFGTVVNAAQGIANQVSGQLGALGSSIKKAINPVITKSAGAKEEERMIKFSLTGTKVTFFVVTVFFVPILVDARYILKLWLKNPPDYAYSFCVLLLFSNIIENLTLFIPQVISSLGKIRDYTIWQTSVGALPLLLSYIGFKLHFPPEFMYLTLIFANILRVIIDLFYGQKLCGINALLFFRQVISRLLLGMILPFIMGESVYYFMAPSLMRFIIISVVSIIAYCLSFFFVVLDQDEKEVAKGVLASAKMKFSSLTKR